MQSNQLIWVAFVPADLARSIEMRIFQNCASSQNFPEGANALWSLHEKNAKSHDDARVQTLKDDMNGVLRRLLSPSISNESLIMNS